MEVQATSNPGELDGVLHRAGSRPIVVAGGDGSLHTVVSALYRRNELKGAVLGLLPLGTGNDFARANGIPLDVEEAAQVAARRARRARWTWSSTRSARSWSTSCTPAPARRPSRRGARWKERLHSIGVGQVNLGRLGYPIGALLAAVKPPVRPAARRGRRRGGRRPRPAGADGRGRQRQPRSAAAPS